MRRVAMVLVLVCSALWWAAGPAHAGGWALSTLDEIPSPVAGQELLVGFTILQHGVTPVHLDRDVGIEVKAASGVTTFFPAQASGAVGHYVATVAFAEPGRATWSIEQGWFAVHDLGEITVAPASTASVASMSADASDVIAPRASAYRWPVTVRYALVAGAFAFVVVAVGSTRRRSHPPVPAQP